jgi:hypothetical protein
MGSMVKEMIIPQRHFVASAGLTPKQAFLRRIRTGPNSILELQL